MRRIVSFDQVSADGYFAAADGNLDWVVQEPELEKSTAANLGGTDTMLFGRKTYEMFESFWPHALDESGTSPDPHHPGRRSPEIRAIAVWINDSAKIVFSRTRQNVTWKNSRLTPELKPQEIEAMKKRQPGGDIMIFGSASIVRTLTEHRLIDEYRFVVCPVLLGEGRPLLEGVPKRLKLKLIEEKAYPLGSVELRYAPSA